MMPSHVIADQLNVDVTAALLSNNAPVVAQIAKLWNTTWDLKPGLKPTMSRSASRRRDRTRSNRVLDGGAVVLVANDRWWGPKAITKRITVWPQAADIQDRVNNRSVDVVDVAAGSSGALATPDNYERADSPSDGIEQLIFAPQGPLAQPKARRAFALCTPRDAIAHDAGVPIANSRLQPATEDAIAAGDGAAEAGPFNKADPAAARDALGGAPLTVRIGYQGPNARLAVTVGVITKSCAAAGITVASVTLDIVGAPGAAGRKDRRAAGQHRRSHRQRVDRVVGDGCLRPAQRQRQQPVRLRESPGRRQRSARWRYRPTPPSASGCWPRPRRYCGATCRRCPCTGSSARC